MRALGSRRWQFGQSSTRASVVVGPSTWRDRTRTGCSRTAGVVERRRDQFLDHVRQSRGRSVTPPPGRDAPTARSEALPLRGDTPVLRNVHVDDLPVLVHRPAHVPPDTVDLHVGLVDEPPVTHGVPGRAGRIDQFRSEALHPAEQGHVIDLDAAHRSRPGPGTTSQSAGTSRPPARSRQEKAEPRERQGTRTGGLERRLRFAPAHSPRICDPLLEQSLPDHIADTPSAELPGRTHPPRLHGQSLTRPPPGGVVARVLGLSARRGHVGIEGHLPDELRASPI